MMSETNIAGSLAVAASASFAASLLIVLTQGWHGKHSLDGDIDGIQKFHTTPVPRVGGVALLIGMLAAFFFAAFGFDYPAAALLDTGSVAKLLLAAVPAFLAGLMEDMTKKISAKSRLLATFASALLACWLVDASLTRLDMWGGDALLQLSPVAAVIITAIAVAGVANSINIIDGFHGVAASAVAIMLAGMGFLAWRADDVFVANLALMGIGATVGFLLINYPTGRLFMGDGGAYFLGFWLAEVAVLLVVRNPDINTWQVLLICSYPVIEVLYSIYRRKVIRKSSPGAPDRLHLHTLIYRRVVCQLLPRNDKLPWIRNAVVACIIATWIAAMTLIAVLVGDTIAAAVSVLMADVLLYIAVYTRLVRGHWRLTPLVPAGVFRSRPVIRELP
jgi:UDP-N-acetylmuramyl pentapeptide phosphotransferase/UDP-N-acetylglucosamine-1-phosphate transferase